MFFFFFQAEDGIRDGHVTGVQTCALPIFNSGRLADAVAAYRVVLERYPQSPYVADAAAGMQYALSAEGDDRRMEAVIDSFAAQNPNSPVVAQLRFRQAEVKYQRDRKSVV